MATGSAAPPILSLQRSGQSGAYALTAAWQVVFTDSGTIPYLFAGATLDFSTLAAGDVVDVRVRKVLTLDGDWVPHDLSQYADARPTNFHTVTITAVADIYGVEIALRQTAGVLRTIPSEFFAAKRLGL